MWQDSNRMRNSFGFECEMILKTVHFYSVHLIFSFDLYKLIFSNVLFSYISKSKMV